MLCESAVSLTWDPVTIVEPEKSQLGMPKPAPKIYQQCIISSLDIGKKLILGHIMLIPSLACGL